MTKTCEIRVSHTLWLTWGYWLASVRERLLCRQNYDIKTRLIRKYLIGRANHICGETRLLWSTKHFHMST